MGGVVAFVIRLVGVISLFVGPACGSEKSGRDDASAVLEAISRLDPNAPVETRRAAINAVAALPLQNQELDALRGVCLDAHRGLLEAEVAQDDVRQALAGTPPGPEALVALQAKMQGAARTLTLAQAALTTCENRSREATVRYR